MKNKTFLMWLTDNLILTIPVITAVLFTVASWLATDVDVPAWLTLVTTGIALVVGQVVVPLRFSKPIHQMNAKGMKNLSNDLRKLKNRYHMTEVFQIISILFVLLLSWFTDTPTPILIAINFLGVSVLMVAVGVIAFAGDGMVSTFNEAVSQINDERSELKTTIENVRKELAENHSPTEVEHLLYFRFGSDYRNNPPSGHRKWLQNMDKEKESEPNHSVKELVVKGIDLLSIPVADRKPYFSETVAEHGDNFSAQELADVFGVTTRTYYRWIKDEEPKPKKIGF